jgi:uncharacterized protein YjbI with pentapeptide repeats
MTYKDVIFSADELDGQSFSADTFLRCSFPSARLKFTSFKRCRFESCDLSTISCDGTNFSSCSFPESKLSDLNLFHVSFADCDFSGAVLRNCVFQSLPGTKASPAKKFNLKSCTFGRADLTGSVFIFCDLSSVPFGQANLERVTFDRCILKKTDIDSAVTDGMQFIDCKIEGAVLDVTGFINYGQSNGFILKQ